MRIGLKSKLIGVFVAGTLFAMVFLGWSVFTINSLLNTNLRVKSLTARVDLTTGLNLRIQRLMKTAGDYLISGDIRKRDEFDVLVREVSGIISVLSAEKGNEKWETMSTRVRDGLTVISTVTVEIMFTDNPVGNKKAVNLMKEATVLGEDLIRDVEEFNRIASNDRETMATLSVAQARSARAVLYAFPAMGLILLVLLYLYMRYYITEPVSELLSDAEAISKGDFSRRVVIKTADELEDLAEGFNRMASALEEREAKLIESLKVVDRINEELIASSRYKAAFLSNMSHELKTPLTHILGFSELLKMEFGGHLPEAGKKYIENVYKSGQSLLKLIDNLLAVTRGAEGAAATLDMKEVDVRSVVDYVVAAINPAVEKKKHILTVDIDRDLKSIRADEGMMRQIILNLLDNAVKYTAEGGLIGLKMFRDVEKEKRVIRFAVSDTGAGISPELRDAIFNPFEVGVKPIAGTPTGSGGIGVGLALVKRFVEFHGGKISLESEPGKGSTFKFFIPDIE